MPDAAAPLQHRGTQAVQRLVEFAPSTGGLALWVGHHDLPDDADDDADAAKRPPKGAPAAPLIATDGHTLFYRAGFDALPLAERAARVAHEVLHIALRHPQRLAELRRLIGDVDARLFNTCADAIVNSSLAHLGWLQLPAGAVLLDTLLKRCLGLDQPVEASLLEWDVERLYRAIDDRRPPAQGGAREDGPRAASARVIGAHEQADLLQPADRDEPPQAQADTTREWRERLVRAHAGDAEFSMLRVLLADLPTSRTPWEQVLRTRLARGLSTRPGISWSRPARSYIANQGRAGPHRRLPWEPGFSGTRRVPRLAVIVDVSGSIDDALMERFAREIEAITRRLEAGLVLVVGDDAVRRVERFEPGRSDLRDVRFTGGGGTDFTPLLEEANRHRPDIAVVLTDLQGPAHFRPRWPVLWAVPEAFAAAPAPFGYKLTLR